MLLGISQCHVWFAVKQKKVWFICLIHRWPDANYEIWRLFLQKITSPCSLTFKFHLYSVPIQLNLFCWLHMQTGLSHWPNFIPSASAVVNFFLVIKRRCCFWQKHVPGVSPLLVYFLCGCLFRFLLSLECQTDWEGVDALGSYKNSGSSGA